MSMARVGYSFEAATVVSANSRSGVGAFATFPFPAKFSSKSFISIPEEAFNVC